jgi:hypothetical protein
MKYPINLQFKTTLQRLILLCVTLFFASASYAHEQVKVVVVPMAGDDLRTVYEIGKTGPAGGIVFHVTDGGRHGLEAAHEDQTFGVVWGCYGVDVPDTNYIISVGDSDPNTGAHNTQAIVGVESCAGGAADVASSYMGPNGITTGWYLPNKQELNLLYLQAVEGTVVGFDDSRFYWSSSQASANDAWAHQFNQFGDQLTLDKRSGDLVRAVRAF